MTMVVAVGAKLVRFTAQIPGRSEPITSRDGHANVPGSEPTTAGTGTRKTELAQLAVKGETDRRECRRDRIQEGHEWVDGPGVDQADDPQPERRGDGNDARRIRSQPRQSLHGSSIAAPRGSA